MINYRSKENSDRVAQDLPIEGSFVSIQGPERQRRSNVFTLPTVRPDRVWQTSVRLFFTCTIVFGLHFATNTVREIYPALSLADHFSFDVSEYKGLHPDIFEISGRGAFINNNPGASIMGAIPYLLSRPLVDRIIKRTQSARAAEPNSPAVEYDTVYPMAQEFYRDARERGLDVKFGLGAAVMQSLVMVPLSSLSAVVMFWLLYSKTENRSASVIFALLYAFATPVLFRTAQLNQNLLVAHFALFAFALLWRPSIGDNEGREPFYGLAGLYAGWTIVLDYSGLVAITALSGYALAKWCTKPTPARKMSQLIRYASGVAACGAVLLVYQWICFGNPFLPAQSYMPPANFTELGYRGFSFPQADLLFDTAFSIKFGLFVSAPLLLLAFYAPAWLREKSRLLGRKETFFILAYVATFFIFCSANQFGRMQFNSGVRHIVPVVPFVFFLAANTLWIMPRLAAVLFGTAATYWSWCLAMYRDVELGSGVLESIKHVTLEGFRLPWLTTLERMGYVHGATAMPILLLAAIVIWIIWSVGGSSRVTEA